MATKFANGKKASVKVTKKAPAKIVKKADPAPVPDQDFEVSPTKGAKPVAKAVTVKAAKGAKVATVAGPRAQTACSLMRELVEGQKNTTEEIKALVDEAFPGNTISKAVGTMRSQCNARRAKEGTEPIPVYVRDADGKLIVEVKGASKGSAKKAAESKATISLVLNKLLKK